MRLVATALAAVLLAAAPAAHAADGLIRTESPYSVATTLDRLADALKAKGLTVFARVDHAANAAGAGLDLPPTRVLIFGNPRLGTPLMRERRSVAIDLPQKALAWKDKDGQVWLAYNDPAWLAERHGLDPDSGTLGKIDKALERFSRKATRAE